MKVLIAVDFSEITSSLLEVVPTLLRACEANSLEIYLIHVAEPNPEFVGWDAGPDVVRDQVAEMFKREHVQLEELAEVLRQRIGAKITPLLIQGPTAETVCRQAVRLDADMVVVGSHGHGAAYNLVVGSISSAIIKCIGKPVLVVPHPTGRKP